MVSRENLIAQWGRENSEVVYFTKKPGRNEGGGGGGLFLETIEAMNEKMLPWLLVG